MEKPKMTSFLKSLLQTVSAGIIILLVIIAPYVIKLDDYVSLDHNGATCSVKVESIQRYTVDEMDGKPRLIIYTGSGPCMGLFENYDLLKEAVEELGDHTQLFQGKGLNSIFDKFPSSR